METTDPHRNTFAIKAFLKEYVERQQAAPDSVEGYKLMLARIHEDLMQFRKGGSYSGMFPERWLPAVVSVLPEPFCEANGTVNSTTKVVRRKVYELFREELDFVFTPEGKSIQNGRNVLNIRRYMGTDKK